MATNSNEVIDLSKKTTKLIRGIHSWIKFQKHQGVESITIQGKQTLADISQDKNGDANLVLNADSDKVDAVFSNVPYLKVAHTKDGSDPFVEKTATISQDLTQFPLVGGELVTVTKETDSLTIHDELVKDKFNNKIGTVHSDVPFLRIEHITDGEGLLVEKRVNISQDLTQFPLVGGELVTVAKTENSLTIQDGQIKDFVNDTLTKKENDIRDFIGEVKTELTNKINEHSGNSSNNRNLIIYQRSGVYMNSNIPCAKFTLPSVSTMSTAILNVIYKGSNDPENIAIYSHATFYVGFGTISNLTQNGVLLEQGNGSDKIDWDITLPNKTNYARFELTIFGNPRYLNETEYPFNIDVKGDTSYTPQ